MSVIVLAHDARLKLKGFVMPRPQVIDSRTNKRISIKEAALEPKDWSGVCHCCHTPIRVGARNLTNRETHFYHSTHGSRCHLIKENAREYEALPPGQRDPGNGVVIKQWLFQHLRAVFFFCKDHLDCYALGYEEFRECIRSATAEGAWEARGLEPLFIPYLILVYTQEFPKNTWRSKSFYYAFEPLIGNVDDLWIHPGRNRKIIFKIDTISRDSDDYEICPMTTEQMNPTRTTKKYFEIIEGEIKTILGV